MKFSGKNNKKRRSDDININDRDSSVSEFVRRPLPNRKEVEEFEEKLNQQSRKEKEERMESGLSEIYKDKEGNMVNVKKIEKKKKGEKSGERKFYFLLSNGHNAGIKYFFKY